MADNVMTVSPDRDAEALLDSRAVGEAQRTLVRSLMADLIAHGRAAQAARNGRELAIFETDFTRIATLVDALAGGNYLSTAAKIAGIAESGIHAWLRASEAGDPRYAPIASLIHTAAALAETQMVALQRNAAAAGPQYWAAAATHLERRYPDRWGRRPEDNNGPKIVVQIGVRDCDVKVALDAAAPLSAPIIGALPSGPVDDDLT